MNRLLVSIRTFPSWFWRKYNIPNLISDDDYVYVKIKKGMYGLKQAAILAYENLVRNLSQYGYRPVPYALGIWKHEKKTYKLAYALTTLE